VRKHTDILPPMSDLTRAIAAPNLSAIRITPVQSTMIQVIILWHIWHRPSIKL